MCALCNIRSRVDLLSFSTKFIVEREDVEAATLELRLPPTPPFLVDRHAAKEQQSVLKKFLRCEEDECPTDGDVVVSAAWVMRAECLAEGHTNIAPGPWQPPDTSRPLDYSADVRYISPGDAEKLCESAGGSPSLRVGRNRGMRVLEDGAGQVLACLARLWDNSGGGDLTITDDEGRRRSHRCWLPAQDSLYAAVGAYTGRRPSMLEEEGVGVVPDMTVRKGMDMAISGESVLELLGELLFYTEFDWRFDD